MTTAEQTPTPAEEIPPEAVADEQQAPPETSPAGPQDDADESGDVEKPKGGVRARLDAAEAERDGLQAKLSAAHDQAIDREIERAGLSPKLIRAAGLEVAAFITEEGSLDYEKLTPAIDGLRAELGLSRRPAPNPVAGRGRGDAPEPTKPSWSGAFSEHRGQIPR